MRLMSFDSIQKKLDKKNAELLEVRSLRKKLADKEKNPTLNTYRIRRLNLYFCRSNAKLKMKNLIYRLALFCLYCKLCALVNHLLTIQTRKKKLRRKLTFLLSTQLKSLTLEGT